MMPARAKFDPDDSVLLRYLLGALPMDEAEPIEEASIVDGEFAARLNAAEHDLVDTYARGELEGSNLARFQNWYLSSPLRAQKVEAAKAIVLIIDSPNDMAAAGKPEVKTAIETKPPDSAKVSPALSYGKASARAGSGGLRFGDFRSWPMWGIAAAAAVLILVVAVGFLTTRNKRLRNEVAETKKQTTELAAKLKEENAGANSNAEKSVGASANLAHGLDNVATVTMFLPSPTRGASTVPTVNIPAGTGLVVLSLGLGSNNEDAYRAQLMDPATQKVFWHSGILRPGSDGTYVSVTVPAPVLRSSVYLLQLTHDAANGRAELLTSYPFRAEVK